MGYFITNLWHKLLVKEFFLIGEHLAKLQATWLIVSYTPFAWDICSQRCRTFQISKITCVWRTETVTDSCCVNNRRIWVYYQHISNCCRPVLTYCLTDLCYQCPTDCWSCTAFSCNIFFFVTTVVYSRYWDFLYGWREHLFVSELNNEHFIKKYRQIL